MSNFENSGPAFPVPLNQGEPWSSMGPCDGMTLRQYAAIKLCVPDSGTDWLDKMIRESLRNEMAAKAMQGMAGSHGYCERGWDQKDLAGQAYELADATIGARGEKK